jgi:hypothetical protein
MEFLIQSRPSSPPEFNAPRYAYVGQSLKADKQPAHLTEFEFAQTVIPLEGGQQCLRLLKSLRLTINETLEFEVQDWGIKMDCLKLPELPRELARRFLFLLSAAENEQLTEKDQADWVKISDYIDFRQFSVDRSPPRYQEGLMQSNKEKVIVVWHDGTRESLPPKVARALGDINVGERFSAHVKLGKNDETIGLKRVSLLGPASGLAEEDWSAWPTKN